MLFFPKRRVLGFQGLLLKFKAKFAGETADFIFQFIDLDEIFKELVDKKAYSEGIKKTDWGMLIKFIWTLVPTEMEGWLSDKEETNRETDAINTTDWLCNPAPPHYVHLLQ